jgi:hypothetical protein
VSPKGSTLDEVKGADHIITRSEVAEGEFTDSLLQRESAYTDPPRRGVPCKARLELTNGISTVPEGKSLQTPQG